MFCLNAKIYEDIYIEKLNSFPAIVLLLEKTLRILGSNRMVLYTHYGRDVYNYLNKVFAER